LVAIPHGGLGTAVVEAVVEAVVVVAIPHGGLGTVV
jgi:hypothetical protein